MEIKKKVFDDFIKWLKLDGLRPRKSERIWKKTILRNLLNDDEMTLENYKDYQVYVDSRIGTKPNIVEQENDEFDYSILIGLSLKTENETSKRIKKYVLVGSMVHLFFERGGDVLLAKEYIKHMLGTNDEIQH